jgi:hypothetical protein
MHTLLFLAILFVGAMGYLKRIPSNGATWTVVILTVFAVFTSPDYGTRLLFALVAITTPWLAYLFMILLSLTVKPFQHYLTWKSDAHRSQVDVAPGHPSYEPAEQRLGGLVRILDSSGFKSRGRVGITIGQQVRVNEFLDRNDGREWVILTAIISNPELPVIAHCTCRFADGTTLVVNNSTFVDASAPVPGYISIRLPSLGNPNDLVRVTMAIAERGTYGPIVPAPLDTDLLTRAHARNKLWQDAEVRAGYMRYDAALDVYRPTLRGAYRMWWHMVPPLQTIVDRRDRAREEQLLREIGLTPSPRTDASGAEPAPKPSRKEYRSAVAAALVLVLIAVFAPEVVGEIGGGAPVRIPPDVRVPDGFVVPDSFSGAIEAFERLVGQPSHQLSGTKDDEPSPTPGVAITMHRDTADAYVEKVQDAFLAKGFYLFRTGEHFNGFDNEALALYPTRDPYEVMRAMDTNGANHGLLVEDVIAWFRREQSQFPIRFGAIAFDYVGGHLTGDDADFNVFARRFIRFCPDLMATGDLTARILARDMRRNREVFCWWD